MTQLTPKYQVGDIVKSLSEHYLIKDIVDDKNEVWYTVYVLETGMTIMFATNYLDTYTQKV